VNLLFNTFSSNLDSTEKHDQLAKQIKSCKVALKKCHQRQKEDAIHLNNLETSWRQCGVSNFRLYEGFPLFDFIRPWLTSFESIVGVIHQQKM
jgi:hypothetical protein